MQREWYKKLKDDGFKDLEHFSFRTSNPNAGQPGHLLKGQSLWNIANKKHWQETYHHYARLRTFLVHNPSWAGPRPIHSLVGKMYADGQSFSKIVIAVKNKGLKDNMNKWHVHHMVKEFVAKAITWNKSSPKGLDFEPDIG